MAFTYAIPIVDMLELPPNRKMKKEYVKVGGKKYGLYLVMHWTENNIHKKLYIGKSLEDYKIRRSAKEYYGTPVKELKKWRYIQKLANDGNKVAKKYLSRVKKQEIQIDTAYRAIRKSLF